ncbi:TPA: hypothetical protein ACK3Q6_001650 [Burkholderia cepacia]|uniref:hypothetical protein n=1 Tax=Burkholderia cepacia TaxID=292 RepID=UPI001CF415FA|nr:hypothetical protein [Burkholderia cepacia]MCA8363165.1 hypothetical protein [Burkholderia cepacia]HDR9756473.1 hypothetical protein [Burkholderia cepacia ATCC 25416]HDV6364694.1 hypothetical protein [Burkholderia cepacia]
MTTENSRADALTDWTDEDSGAMLRAIDAIERIASGMTQTSADHLFAKTKPRKMTITDAKELASVHLPGLRRLFHKMEGFQVAASPVEQPAAAPIDFKRPEFDPLARMANATELHTAIRNVELADCVAAWNKRHGEALVRLGGQYEDGWMDRAALDAHTRTAQPAPSPADERAAKPTCSLCGDSGYYVVDGPTSEADGHHPNLEPCDCKAELAAAADDREPVDEVLEIVASYGPYGRDINEGLRFQIVLADEVKRLRAASATETGAEGAAECFIVIGHGETDIPEAKIVTRRDDLLDAVLGMIYSSPSDAPDDVRAMYAQDLDDEDCAGHWSWSFEIGGINAWRVGLHPFALPHSPAMAAEAVAVVRDNPDDLGTIIEATRPLAIGTKLYAAPQPAQADAPTQQFPYQKTFNAIAAATSVEGGNVSISVKAFRDAFGDAQVDAREGLTDALRQAREELSLVEWENDPPARVTDLFSTIDALLQGANHAQ